MSNGTANLTITVNFLFIRGLMLGTSRQIGDLSTILEGANEIYRLANVSIARGPIVENVDFGEPAGTNLWERATITTNPDGSVSRDMRRLIQLLRAERRHVRRRNELIGAAGGSTADVNVFFVRNAEVRDFDRPYNLAGEAGGFFQEIASEEMILIDDGDPAGYSVSLALAHEVLHWAQARVGVSDRHNTSQGNLMGTDKFPVITRPDGTTIQRIGKSRAGPSLTDRQIEILRRAARSN